ncbi:hypothetical protein KY363_07200 [Candidatus Woesearchaeota archaeon]|nr:hypothetical protein [Candidatus Woesearchaeota archaeon]
MKPFEQEFTDFIGQVFQRLGLDSLSSTLVGIIFLEPKEVSMDELAEKTGYSLASLSNKLRALESMNMVKRVSKPGSKKAYYYIEKDVNEILRRKLQVIYEQFLEPARTTLPSIIDKYRNTKLSAEEKQKMDIIINYQKQLLDMGKCIEKHMKELDSWK